MQREITALRPLVPRTTANDRDIAAHDFVAFDESALANIAVSPIIDAGLLDPFQSYPTSRVPGLDGLMKNCRYDFS
jgi:hypothetical protein